MSKFVAVLEVSNNNPDSVLEDHSCMVCYEPYLFQPRRHTLCKKVFCVGCLSQWRKQGKPCPNCRGKLNNETVLDCTEEFAAEAAQVLIVCGACKIDVVYSEYAAHQKECEQKAIDNNINKSNHMDIVPSNRKQRFVHIHDACTFEEFKNAIPTVQLVPRGKMLYFARPDVDDNDKLLLGVPILFSDRLLPFGIQEMKHEQMPTQYICSFAIKPEERIIWQQLTEHVITVLARDHQALFSCQFREGEDLEYNRDIIRRLLFSSPIQPGREMYGKQLDSLFRGKIAMDPRSNLSLDLTINGEYVYWPGCLNHSPLQELIPRFSVGDVCLNILGVSIVNRSRCAIVAKIQTIDVAQVSLAMKSHSLAPRPIPANQIKSV
jgi:hypothetical protein